MLQGLLLPLYCSKKWKAGLSRRSSAGLTSKNSFSRKEFDISSTEKGMLHRAASVIKWKLSRGIWVYGELVYLELSSSRKELLSASFVSSVIIIRILESTYLMDQRKQVIFWIPGMHVWIVLDEMNESVDQRKVTCCLNKLEFDAFSCSVPPLASPKIFSLMLNYTSLDAIENVDA